MVTVGAAEPWGGGQVDAVQDGGQLPHDRGVGPGQAAGRTESLVVAAVESVKVGQEGGLLMV